MSHVLFIDLETDLIGPANQAPDPIVLSYCGFNQRGLVAEQHIDEFMEENLRRAAEGELLLVAHNAAFDFAVLSNRPALRDLVWKAYEKDAIACTLVREKLIAIYNGEHRSYPCSLGALAYRFLHVELDKSEDGWRTRYSELRGVPLDDWPEEAVKYAVEDAVYGRELFYNQDARIRETDYRLPTQFDEARGAFALYLTKAWGIRVDPERVSMLDDLVSRRMSDLEAQLVEDGLLVRKGSKKKMKEEDELGLPKSYSKSIKLIKERIEKHWPPEQGAIPRTDKEAIKTGKEIIEVCNDEVLDRLIEFNALQKQSSTYLTALKKGLTEPIHAGFDSLGASSSRTSCRAPNLQNQPKLPGMRECFRARPGCAIIACDFNSQEMRTFAQACLDIVKSSRLAAKYNQDPDFDPHLEFAAQTLLNIPMEEALKLKEAGDKKVKEARQRAKIANFGLPGGMGPGGLVRYAKGYGVVLTRDEATKLKESWFSQWPEAEDYFDFIRKQVNNNPRDAENKEIKVSKTMLPRSGFVRGGVGYCDCANTHFQSLAAHASKAAMFAVAKECYAVPNSPLYGSRPINFVHDEILIETPLPKVHEAAKRIEKVMEEAMARFTPDVPPRASAEAMINWSKDAEAVYENGRMVPWIPSS